MTEEQLEEIERWAKRQPLRGYSVMLDLVAEMRQLRELLGDTRAILTFTIDEQLSKYCCAHAEECSPNDSSCSAKKQLLLIERVNAALGKK